MAWTFMPQEIQTILCNDYEQFVKDRERHGIVGSATTSANNNAQTNPTNSTTPQRSPAATVATPVATTTTSSSPTNTTNRVESPILTTTNSHNAGVANANIAALPVATKNQLVN